MLLRAISEQHEISVGSSTACVLSQDKEPVDVDSSVYMVDETSSSGASIVSAQCDRGKASVALLHEDDFVSANTKPSSANQSCSTGAGCVCAGGCNLGSVDFCTKSTG